MRAKLLTPLGLVAGFLTACGDRGNGNDNLLRGGSLVVVIIIIVIIVVVFLRRR